MEMVLNNASFMELTNDEMLEIDGGRNWDRIFGGVVLGLTGITIVLTAPATVPAAALGCLVYTMAAVGGAYAGYGWRS